MIIRVLALLAATLVPSEARLAHNNIAEGRCVGGCCIHPLGLFYPHKCIKEKDQDLPGWSSFHYSHAEESMCIVWSGGKCQKHSLNTRNHWDESRTKIPFGGNPQVPGSVACAQVAPHTHPNTTQVNTSLSIAVPRASIPRGGPGGVLPLPLGR